MGSFVWRLQIVILIMRAKTCMHLKRAWQSPACSRWAKPLALAAVFAAASLFYSCRKFDPREHIAQKQAVEDTVALGKAAFREIGKREFKDETPMADTMKDGTAAAMAPLKPRALVAAPGSE